MPDEPKTPPDGLTTAAGVRTTQRIVGPVAPPVYTAGAKPGAAQIVSDTEPLVTEGMKARQRAVEKKRRLVASLRAVEEEEASERWGRGRAWIFRLVGVLVALGVYWKMQAMYDNRWPLLAVWIFLAVLLGVLVSWLLWYLDYSD